MFDIFYLVKHCRAPLYIESVTMKKVTTDIQKAFRAHTAEEGEFWKCCVPSPHAWEVVPVFYNQSEQLVLGPW